MVSGQFSCASGCGHTWHKNGNGNRISSVDLVNCLPDGTIQTVHSFKYPSREIKAKLGIPFKYHYLRHTYGTMMAEMNTPTHLLCNQMGHGNIRITQRYYLGVSPTGIEALHNNLEHLWNIYKHKWRDFEGLSIIFIHLPRKNDCFIWGKCGKIHSPHLFLIFIRITISFSTTLRVYCAFFWQKRRTRYRNRPYVVESEKFVW